MFNRKHNIGGATATASPSTYEVTKSEDEWKAELTPDRYAVLRRAGTEPAWSGELLHVDGEGVFHCAGCGADAVRHRRQVRLRVGLAQLRPGPLRGHHHRAV